MPAGRMRLQVSLLQFSAGEGLPGGMRTVLIGGRSPERNDGPVNSLAAPRTAVVCIIFRTIYV